MIRCSFEPKHSERGASLIMALAVMLAISGILGGLVTLVTSSTKVAVRLREARAEEYAADAAVEQAIRAVQDDTQGRGLIGNICTSTGVDPFFLPRPAVINGVAIRVDCAGDPASSLDALYRVVILRNVVFTACVDSGTACTDTTAIIQAKVNFPTNAAGVVTGAFIQSWSVT